ncbi:hypothetical protein [uncultured Lacinutrix sp.]|uniref:HflX-like GTP-binding protein n=1 Tax=uncultured Lacinutrix sp. TaxID=574032 RepID=UPI002602806F|nr:hypothetical protein [uncultured Lacinutrix sp.]
MKLLINGMVRMHQINGKRVIISGLVSSKLNLEDHLISIRDRIINQGGLIVGELVQRRGVSRSKKPGGSKMLDLPLSARTYISTGKVEELKELSKNINADIVVFINNLNDSQIQNIESLTETKVVILNSLDK